MTPVSGVPLVEVCVEGIDAVAVAQEHGADRVELCASLSEGGVTPSLGTVRAAVAVARIPVHVIVRPRGGDFLYSGAEFLTMLEDVRLIRETGAQGVVSGCLTPEGAVDLERTRALIAAARPLSVTFHRAFDLTPDPFRALEDLIACGVDRVLTSGQQRTAVLGADLLGALLKRAEGRIVILGCGGLRPDSVGTVLRRVPLLEIHFSALRPVGSRTETQCGQGERLSFGTHEEEARLVTSGEQVAATIAAARQAAP